ncbi:MAG: MmgE/PrpD family protein [Gammaproteobacteria bacterium]|nr:MmgE/PrpD family protein [Gammaproteobacteria bacterium]NIR84993.1 MmgE/PrpD family protein [Gammaproteobacteria bacterium]NIR88260.1 MmgE/PrpD family protein [Gammaproteobacteria bacterium]NIU06040.1 MmgE/PrpD family protein [Gammaproteobacteria bacterium]NIV73459.1 MmgE/PrpD family protein [Gammaproteobacteria bacterium]
MTARGLTREAAEFAAQLRYEDIPERALHIARRCLIDGLGVMLAGSEQPALDVAERYARLNGGNPHSRVVGDASLRLPAPLAAFWNGLAGHAMDWDDTQLAEGPGRPYGLLTHPTVPVLSASLVIADLLGGVEGKTFLSAFAAGFEVECKVAEAINPDHYNLGFHTTGTIGTFGAAVAAARLLGLDAPGIARTIGGAASMAAGIRANFGTMGKPMHAGRAAQNGVTSALLVREGFTFNEEALDGQWGYLSVAGRGGEPELVLGRFGNPFSMVSPGVSIKPYPCGVLTHPSMDAMNSLMKDHVLAPQDIEKVTLYAGHNILQPIRFRIATSELEGKFCMAFLLSAIILRGKAGKSEFTDEFVRSHAVQEMQARVETQRDPAIDAMGYERIRSRIEVGTRDGRRLERWADENYRGGPDNPLSDAELEGKFRDCAHGLLEDPRVQELFDTLWALDEQGDVTVIYELLDWRSRSTRITG